MKIPEISANVGAYYGNEENGQWQPNGVIIDNGVGGGVVGSGDAGMHRPPVYPVHIPRAHVPAGYVMAGPYYGAPYATVPQPNDFSDYMWMENEDEFDKQVLQQLEEEALMEQCIEAMLEDEKRERRANRQSNQNIPTTSNGVPPVSLEECVSRSTLNPLAAEFVPTRVRQPPAPSRPDEIKETLPTLEAEAPSPSEEPCSTETESAGEGASKPNAVDEERTEETVTPPKDPPEVSAADIHPNAKQLKKDKEVKKQDPKKVIKADPKKKPIAVVKSETKVQPKKKELKPVKSDGRVEERTEEVVPVPLVAELPKPQTLTTEEPTTPSLKPINYAAAARASKPKPKSTTPPSEKPTPQPVKEKPQESIKEKPKLEKVEKKVLPKEKSVPKEKLNMQRKNSAK